MANHFAKLENSPRLQRVLKALQEGGWLSTFEVTSKGRTPAAAAAINELRHNGLKIERRQKTKDGTTTHYYRLVPEIKEQMNFQIGPLG